MRTIAILASLTLSLVAQEPWRECSQSQSGEIASCETCTAGESSSPAPPAQANLITAAYAHGMFDAPTAHCQYPCGWEFEAAWTTGGGTVDYSNTYIQVGNGTKKYATSPANSVVYGGNPFFSGYTISCSAESSTTRCLTFIVSFEDGSWIRKCRTITCNICPPAPLD